MTGERDWRSAGAAVKRVHKPPSILAAFNWLGLAAHGGWFAMIPFLEYIEPHYRSWALTLLAVPLFLGHCYLWDLRRRRNR